MELCFALCADSMGFNYFSQLSTFKIKTICWKQSTKWKYIHYRSFLLLFLFVVAANLKGASLRSHHQRSHTEGTAWWELCRDSYFARIVWVKKVDHTGSVSSTQTQKNERLYERIRGPTSPKGDAVERSEQSLRGKRCHFGVHNEVEHSDEGGKEPHL